MVVICDWTVQPKGIIIQKLTCIVRLEIMSGYALYIMREGLT
jgi:hypothetical protein